MPFNNTLLTKTVSPVLLRNSIELLKLEIGTRYNLFSLKHDMYNSLATNCWIKGVLKFPMIMILTFKNVSLTTSNLEDVKTHSSWKLSSTSTAAVIQN